jgi:hypothetical protein
VNKQEFDAMAKESKAQDESPPHRFGLLSLAGVFSGKNSSNLMSPGKFVANDSSGGALAVFLRVSSRAGDIEGLSPGFRALYDTASGCGSEFNEGPEALQDFYLPFLCLAILLFHA